MNLTNSKNILIIIAVFILCAFFVISFHTTTITTNPPFSNTREKIINFTISNSAGTGNLTYFNISSINQTAFNATFKHVINNNSDTNCILDSDFLVNCTMVSNLSPSTSTWVEINISTSTDGNYSFMIESVDDASEINQTIVNYIFDTINPSINIVSPTPGQLFTTSTVFYMLTSDEVLSSCVFSINDWSTNFSMVLNATGKEANFTNTSVSDGSYTALYWCNDTANNINDTQTVAFIVDATSPTINLIMTANGTVSNNTTPTLSFNITDNYDTMLNYSVYINGVVNSTGNISNNTQQTIHISSLNDGFYSFNIETFDDAEHYVNSTILYLTIDTSPPVYNLSGISTSTSTKGSIVYIWAKFWDAVSDIDTVWLYSENNLNQTNASHNLNFSLVNFSYTVPDDVDGATLNFTIYANDSVGYTANTSIITLYVNDTPPTISINKPDNIETVAHFNISLNTSSDANICLINAIWIDDAGGSDELLNNTLTSGTLSTNNRLCTKFAGFKNGNYNLTFYINDSGNKQNTTSKTFLMNDLTPPIIIFNSSADVSVTYNSAVIRWSTNEYVNGSIRYGTSLELSGIGTADTTFDSKEVNSSLTGLSASQFYYYNITSCDYAGNCNTSGPFNFTTSSRGSSGSSRSSSSSSSTSSSESSPDITVIKTYIKTFGNISAEGLGIFDIDDREVGVTSLKIKVKTGVSNIKITIKKFLNAPPSLVKPKAKYAFQYMEIDPGILKNQDISFITIAINVKKNWTEQYNLKKEDIVLYRYVNNGWEALPTNFSYEDSIYYYYTATSTGFSYFMIGDKEQVVQQPITTTLPIADTPPTPPQATPPLTLTPPPIVPPKEKSFRNISWLFVIMGIFIIGVLIAIYSLNRNKEKNKKIEEYYKKLSQDIGRRIEKNEKLDIPNNQFQRQHQHKK